MVREILDVLGKVLTVPIIVVLPIKISILLLFLFNQDICDHFRYIDCSELRAKKERDQRR